MLATKTTQSTPKKFFFLHFFWFQNLSERKRVVRERGVMGERKVAVRERATVERDGLVREGAAVRERERELLWVTGEKTGVLWGNERDGAAAEGEREAREGEREWCERKREYFGAREALEEEADCCVWKRGPREREGECWERERNREALFLREGESWEFESNGEFQGKLVGSERKRKRENGRVLWGKERVRGGCEGNRVMWLAASRRLLPAPHVGGAGPPPGEPSSGSVTGDNEYAPNLKYICLL